MTAKINRSARSSLFGDVTETLRERIRSGFYPAGERLPAERFLTGDLAVDRRVVRAAIARLTEEGLISQRPNCRPVVDIQPIRDLSQEEGSARGEAGSLSRFVALVMWHGNLDEQPWTTQQRIFWGMNQALGQAGYHGTFLDLGQAIGSIQENAEREAAHLQYILDQGFGGAVLYIYAYQSNRELIQEVARRIPLVLIDRTLTGVQSDFVGVDNGQGIADAMAHLRARGHRRIAYVTQSESINPVQDRLHSYLRAADEADMAEIIIIAPFAAEKRSPVFDLVFSQPAGERPTAAVCVNDYEAVHVAKRLEALGLKVPDDVAVVGFDDIVQHLPNGIGLSSIAQPFEELGMAAARQFLRRVQAPNAIHCHIELPVRLIIRDSSAAFLDPAQD